MTILRAEQGGGGSIPGSGREFPLCHDVQIGCGAHITSWPVGTGYSFFRGSGVCDLGMGRGTENLPASSTELKNMSLHLHGVAHN